MTDGITESGLATPHIQCAVCHGTLSEHAETYNGLEYRPLECCLSVEDLRQQVYAWADYALGNPDRARERNYRERTGTREGLGND